MLSAEPEELKITHGKRLTRASTKTAGDYKSPSCLHDPSLCVTEILRLAQGETLIEEEERRGESSQHLSQRVKKDRPVKVRWSLKGFFVEPTYNKTSVSLFRWIHPFGLMVFVQKQLKTVVVVLLLTEQHNNRLIDMLRNMTCSKK